MILAQGSAEQNCSFGKTIRVMWENLKREKKELTWLSFFHKWRIGESPFDQSSLSNFEPVATERLRTRSCEITWESINSKQINSANTEEEMEQTYWPNWLGLLATWMLHSHMSLIKADQNKNPSYYIVLYYTAPELNDKMQSKNRKNADFLSAFLIAVINGHWHLW